jgi:hypothetical protein
MVLGIYPITRALFWTCLIATICNVSAGVSNIDSLYYFYERTIYLEDLSQNCAWWSNPSRISSVNEPCVYTSNTGLLGGKYSISGIRFITPLRPSLTIGFGLTGTSTAIGLSGVGNDSGAQMTSNFNFSRPSLEAGAGYRSPWAGTFGALVVTGTESMVTDPTSGISNYFFILGTGFGYLSPPIAGMVHISVATLSVCHLQVDTWWDHGAKIGLLVNIGDSLAVGVVEYGFSPQSSLDRARNKESPGYEVVKATVSTRFRSIAGFILGYSSDTKNFRDNGPTFHTGLELRPSKVYQYWGGYEMGVSPWSSRHDSSRLVITILHRFWVGYTFRKK